MSLRSGLAVGVAFVVAGGAALAGCSSEGTLVPSDGGAHDASLDGAATDDAPAVSPDAAADAPAADAATPDGAGPGPDGGADASDASLHVVAMAIVSAYGTPLQAARGDAVPLEVDLTMSDGSHQVAPAGAVSWTAPATIEAQPPSSDAGTPGLPEAGAAPLAFFVRNPLRGSTPGLLFVVDRGTSSAPSIDVRAAYGDAGLSASIALGPDPVGVADAGEHLFRAVLDCSTCHGDTANGSPPLLAADGGLELVDGSPVYDISGQSYPFPAPGLNAAPGSGHVAVDPTWTPGLFAMAAQAGMDNQGVALRLPMPLWAGGNDGNGHALDAQDFADLYAWLLTQTQ